MGQEREIIKTIRGLLKKKRLEPYIKHIRFPYFRNLERGLRIDFDFPLTALVGQNGTNKSSILRAIFGVPGYNNIGNFWFSTQVDPIEETIDKNRFIYGYYQADAKRDVEVIKTRATRKKPMQNSSKRGPIENPDYWEPSRPLLKDDMEKMPEMEEGAEFAPGRRKTRWKLIEKNVLFMDFRSEISAFDKYFYHGELKKTLSDSTKQDFIRRKSKNLRKCIDKKLVKFKSYKKDRVFANESLDNNQVELISKILGRKYEEIRVINHSLFNLKGYSVILKSYGLNKNRIQYSEAFAGSGEFSVCILVYRIMKLKPNSLIILDEPEVSLHPGAQERLVEFLLERIKENKHQIVLGTHSPYIIKRLPPDAIKTLFLDQNNSVKVTKKTLPEEAFFHLGIKEENTIRIFVEDRLAKAIVEKSLRNLGEAIHKQFTVGFVPGGADTLLQHYFPVYARTGMDDAIFILDGDHKTENDISSLKNIESLPTDNLLTIMSDIIKVDNPAKFLPVDGGKDGGNKEQFREALIKVIRYASKHLFFLDCKTPEEFIWKNMKYDIPENYTDFSSIPDHKEKFRLLTKWELGRAEYEDVNSDRIFFVQEKCLTKVADDHHFIASLSEKIKQFISNFSSKIHSA